MFIFRPDAGGNKSDHQRLSANKLSKMGRSSGESRSGSSGPSSPQHNDRSEISSNLCVTTAVSASESKAAQLKNYPVIFGELVILG